ncbi:MAG: hypothetical protein SNG69_09695 [Rikenellaceae bacterium]
MEMLIDDCIILDYGRILTHRPTREILDNFRRFRFDSTQEVVLSDDRLWSVERIVERWECYSFCDMTQVSEILSPFSVSNLTQESISLEDAFIGLTGKY